LSSYSDDPLFGIQARRHASVNGIWISVSVPAQLVPAKPSGVIGPDGYGIAQCQATADLVLVHLSRSEPRFNITLNKARPWRRLMRDGTIYHDRRSTTVDHRDSFWPFNRQRCTGASSARIWP
jgi:hypothetical protein